jgi:hypothetical protein
MLKGSPIGLSFCCFHSLRAHSPDGVDARDKPGHDEGREAGQSGAVRGAYFTPQIFLYSSR